MFIAAMSTIAKLWKEPQYPSKDEWIKKTWFMYTMQYYYTFYSKILRTNMRWIIDLNSKPKAIKLLKEIIGFTPKIQM